MSTHRFCGVVAIDGPSGSGKSTTARLLSRELGAQYLDTGAMYRAVTVAVLHHGADPVDADAVEKVLSACTLQCVTDPDAPSTILNGNSVDVEIRSAETTAAVSAVASHAGVRTHLVSEQKKIIAAAVESTDERCGIVVEGRDIGSVVAPEADLKVYLTASTDARAQRRHREGTQGEQHAESVKLQLERRDKADSTRDLDPLRVVSGAVEVDTTHLTPDEVVKRLRSLLPHRRRTHSGA